MKYARFVLCIDLGSFIFQPFINYYYSNNDSYWIVNWMPGFFLQPIFSKGIKNKCGCTIKNQEPGLFTFERSKNEISKYSHDEPSHDDVITILLRYRCSNYESDDNTNCHQRLCYERISGIHYFELFVHFYLPGKNQRG